MKEVFLALRPFVDDCCYDSFNVWAGVCSAIWIHDASLISKYMNEGWYVYRANGFQRITEVALELKLENDHGTECAQSAIANH